LKVAIVTLNRVWKHALSLETQFKCNFNPEDTLKKLLFEVPFFNNPLDSTSFQSS